MNTLKPNSLLIDSIVLTNCPDSPFLHNRLGCITHYNKTLDVYKVQFNNLQSFDFYDWQLLKVPYDTVTVVIPSIGSENFYTRDNLTYDNVLNVLAENLPESKEAIIYNK